MPPNQSTYSQTIVAMDARHPQNTAIWPRLGLGTGTLASLGRAISLPDVRKMIATMIDEGIKVIDTADTYGSGDCEHLLGKALGNHRESFIIVTKAGYRHSNLRGPMRHLNQIVKKVLQKFGPAQDFDPGYLIRCLENSLRRLNTDHVDGWLLHDPPLEVLQKQEVLDACERLKSTGKALKIGISSGHAAVIRKGVELRVFDIVQTTANLKAAAVMEPLWHECSRLGMHIMGNHIFEPSCLKHPDINHEMLMRACAALLPAEATILCGTKNPAHLVQSNEWAKRPLNQTEARNLMEKLAANS